MGNFNCNSCGTELTEVQYRLQRNNTTHLVGFCSKCGWKYLPKPRVKLDIPTTTTVDVSLKSIRKKNRRIIKRGFIIEPKLV